MTKGLKGRCRGCIAANVPEPEQWWQVTLEGLIRNHRGHGTAICAGAGFMPIGPTKVFFEPCQQCPTVIQCAASGRCPIEEHPKPDEKQPGLF
jgi:hypothetical protein